MKIAWFTPLSASTGIARYSLSVVAALAVAADIELWAPPTDKALTLGDLDCPVRTIVSPAAAARETANADLRVYNLGNNPAHHSAIYETSRLAPGLIILHDKVMQDFFFSHLDPSRYYRLMTYLYGADGGSAAVRALADGRLLSDPEFVESFPLFEPCLVNAEAVLVHSRGAAELMRPRYGELLLISSVQLPVFKYDAQYGDRPLASREELDIAADALLIVATGRVGPSKRLEDVVDAVAAEDLPANSLFVSVGAAEPGLAEALLARAETLGVANRVRFVTDADDWTLHSYLSCADLCVNLRYPSTESSSATLVEQLHFEKPVVVYDVGVYSELPDDVVVKVPIEDRAAGVARALAFLARDAHARAGYAARAAEYTRQNCDPVRFAEKLLELAELAVSNRSVLEAIDASAESIGPVRSVNELRSMAEIEARRMISQGILD